MLHGAACGRRNNTEIIYNINNKIQGYTYYNLTKQYWHSFNIKLYELWLKIGRTSGPEVNAIF